MKKETTINVNSLIDRKIGIFQLHVLLLCFLISVVDGLDSQIMSVTGPIIARDLSLPPSSLGPLLSASQWGALCGAFFFGYYADRVGRRRVLILCGLLLSITTLATALADSYASLVALRVVTGLGVGGAVPCFLSLAMEFSPERHRATVVSVMVAAVPCGGIVAGVLGAALLSNFDWRMVFWVCGALSAIVTVLVIVRMPESVTFLVSRRRPAQAIRKILAKIAPGEISPEQRGFTVNDPREDGATATVRELFRDNRAALTLLCWMAFFLSYLVLIGTLVWTPGLMRKEGMDIADASMVLSLNNIGSIVGLALVGYFVDRFRVHFWSMLAAIYLGGATCVVVMGYAAPSFWPVAVFSALTGFFMASGVGVLYAYVAQLYPTHVRSTGLGWASGLGRIGSSTGPLAVGWMFAGGWQMTSILLAIGAITAANVFVVAMLRASGGARVHRTTGSPAPLDIHTTKGAGNI